MFQVEGTAEVKALWGRELFSAPLREQNKEGAWGRLEMGRQEWAAPS